MAGYRVGGGFGISADVALDAPLAEDDAAAILARADGDIPGYRRDEIRVANVKPGVRTFVLSFPDEPDYHRDSFAKANRRARELNGQAFVMHKPKE